jgi:hypothetical protein
VIVHECEQYTPAWEAARLAKATASRAADIVAQPRKGYPEAAVRMDYRVELALARIVGRVVEGNGYKSKWMERGLMMQDEAVAAYEAETGELVQAVGFLEHDELPIGCSPDGILGHFAAGLEVKCPKPATHFGYLQLKGKLPAEYLPQILHSLFVTGLPYWDFASYHPDFPGATQLYRVRVARDAVAADLAAYELALRLFLTHVEKTVEQLRALSAVEE